jgi:two-component system LytT family sensor kinase
MRTKAIKLLTILPHIFFWGFFSLIFLQQNPEAVLQDYLAWLKILGVSAVVVYVNLYLLFPKLFFRKKYLIYSLFLVLNVGLGALSLRLLFPSGNATFAVPVLQHFINLFFFVVITSSFKFFREYSRKQELLIKVENEQLKTELSLLKAQINPHFLFNTLNNLYGLITQNKKEKAAEITLKLSDLMRYLLESSKTDKVSLQKELKFIEDYLALEKVRLAQNADIRFEVSGIVKEVFVAPLLFIPLLENAFKHGLQGISENSFAHFSIALQDNELYFEAKNSVGKNLDSQTQSGTGLENLRKRLMLIYPDKHLLDIENAGGVFKITLQLSL